MTKAEAIEVVKGLDKSKLSSKQCVAIETLVEGAERALTTQRTQRERTKLLIELGRKVEAEKEESETES